MQLQILQQQFYQVFVKYKAQINGLGERCGNANLMSLIPTLFLKKDFSSKFEIGIKSKNITNLTDCSRLLDEILNRKPNQHLPYVGAAAFFS